MNEMPSNGPVKQLRRTRNGRIIAGVCSGTGEYIGVDANILRLVLAVATFFGGLGIGIYAVAWLLIPEQDRNNSIVQDLIDKNKDGHVWQDAKSKWDDVQSNWSRPSQQPTGYEQQPTGYEQHPYGRPSAPQPEATRPEDRPQA
jgi:phage shock protein PspC (stress-responsive transcriptional regulator)